MTADREILTVARSYLARYGPAAKVRAQRRADVLEAYRGNIEGRDVWLNVVRMIERL
jgi:hypothetical protein